MTTNSSQRKQAEFLQERSGDEDIKQKTNERFL